MALIEIPGEQAPAQVIVVPEGEQGRSAATQSTTTVPATAAQPSGVETQTWLKWYGFSIAIAAAAYVIAYEFVLPNCSFGGGCNPQALFRVNADLSLFAALFVLALAVERLLEPVSRWIGPNTDESKDERDTTKVAAVESGGGSTATVDADKLKAYARAQAQVDQDRSISSVMMWGVAVGISFILAAKIHVLLVSSIATEGSTPPAAWVDLLVTGLVIGAGTKPLHDLVSHIEKKKEAAEDPNSVK